MKMKLEPGARLGDYEVLSPLGTGGMGEVYRAMDLKLGRDVAIKVLRQEFSSDRERLSRFEREARSASAPAGSKVQSIRANTQASRGQAARPHTESLPTWSRRAASDPLANVVEVVRTRSTGRSFEKAERPVYY